MNFAEIKPADMAALAAVISSITAICALFIGAWVQLRNAERSVRATVRSSNRQKWIDQLRDEVSGAMTTLLLLQLQLKGGEQTAEDRQATVAKYLAHSAKVDLLINANEKLHTELAELVRSAVSTIQAKDTAEVARATAAIAAKAREIFKLEWERVKKME